MLWDMRSVDEVSRSSNIRLFESGQLGTRWRHSPRWKNDEDHVASIVNDDPLMFLVIAYRAGPRCHIAAVLLGRQ